MPRVDPGIWNLGQEGAGAQKPCIVVICQPASKYIKISVGSYGCALAERQLWAQVLAPFLLSTVGVLICLVNLALGCLRASSSLEVRITSQCWRLRLNHDSDNRVIAHVQR